MTKWHEGFYQIIKDSRFPICHPYGTEGSDKNYDFGTKFWDGTIYKANETNSNNLLKNKANLRSTKLREDYTDNNYITEEEWNLAITKLRQEFYIREELPIGTTYADKKDYFSHSKFLPDTQLVTGSDNGQFFNSTDTIKEKDYLHMFNDVLTLILYETASESGINNDRIPRVKFSYNYIKDDGIGKVDLLNMKENPNCTSINEGTHQGNNWFDNGRKMREYTYRNAVGGVSRTIGYGTSHPHMLPIQAPADVMTNANYGYTPRGSVVINQDALAILATPKSLNSTLKPHGNIDYIKKDLDGNLVLKDKENFDISDEYKRMVEARKQYVSGKIQVPLKTQKKVGVDEYGNDIYDTEIITREMKLVQALTRPTVTVIVVNENGKPEERKYSVDIRANNINNYFMKMINTLASTCVCNCNYCSCYGHEASCICYVVKVNGWCYSYQYLG